VRQFGFLASVQPNCGNPPLASKRIITYLLPLCCCSVICFACRRPAAIEREASKQHGLPASLQPIELLF
jgi:hypothetical protein